MPNKEKIDPDGTYAIGAAARLLGVSASTLRDLQRRGKLACSRTPGGQRRIVGSELLRILEESTRVPPKQSGPTSSKVAATTTDTAARQAWLGPLIMRAQRELPTDTPAEIRLRLGEDLEHALRHCDPTSIVGDVEPLVKRLIDRARLQAQTAREDAQRRETKAQLLEHAQAHLRRSIEGLPARVVGVVGSLKRRHVRATLRDKLRDLLEKRVKGHEPWDQVRELVDDTIATWFVEQPRDPVIPNGIKLVAAGVTGVVGGASAAATLNPEIRAGAAKLKGPLLLLAFRLLKHFNAPSPSASPPPDPASQAATPPAQSGPSTGMVGVWPPTTYGRIPRRFRPVTPTSQEAASEGSATSDAQTTPPATTNRDAAPHESP